VAPSRRRPAIANAVNDALRPLGVELMQSPITPYRVVEAVLAARDAERPAA
jgi:carbon-monoxide dehydrogenase large subunit